MNDSFKFTSRFDKDAAFSAQFSPILIDDAIVIAAFPDQTFVQLRLDWENKVGAPVPVRLHAATGAGGRTT